MSVSRSLSPESMRRRALAIRFVLGPAVITFAFFFAETNRPFSDVWKPLLLYYALAIPAFFLVDYVKRRAAGAAGASPK